MVSKADYLDYMKGSGYLTSPIFQQGFEEWDPTGGVMGVGGKMAEEFRALKDAGGANFLNQFVSTKHSPASSAELYPYPDYTPGAWEPEFGHEISHGGWEYDDKLEKIKSEFGGGTREGGEETFNYLHDLLYGGDYNKLHGSVQNFLRQNKLYGYLPVRGKYPGMTTNYIQRTRGRDLLPAAYDAIRNSGLVDWQKGMLMQGPTTAAGQIALKQKSDEVKAQGQAYMDPNRGNVQAPTMTQQQMVQEAIKTGGTVNPHEATKAVYTPTATTTVKPKPRRRHHALAQGGMVSIMDLLNRRV